MFHATHYTRSYFYIMYTLRVSLLHTINVRTSQHVIAHEHVIADFSSSYLLSFSCILGFGSPQPRVAGTSGLLVVASSTVRTRRYPTKRFHGGKENHTIALSERVSVSALVLEIIPNSHSADTALNQNITTQITQIIFSTLP